MIYRSSDATSTDHALAAAVLDPVTSLIRRPRAALPKLGDAVPHGPVLLDANVFINALAGRGPTVLGALLEAVPRLFVAAPARAELAWIRGGWIRSTLAPLMCWQP